MFVRAIFLFLLPAVVLAGCDSTALNNFFETVDTNNDNRLSKTEAFDFFDAVDADNNTEIILPEVKSASARFAPKLLGYEEYLVRVMDLNKDQKITKLEAFLDFLITDRNLDGEKSREEFDVFINVLCPLLNPGEIKLNCLPILCGVTKKLNLGLV